MLQSTNVMSVHMNIPRQIMRRDLEKKNIPIYVVTKFVQAKELEPEANALCQGQKQNRSTSCRAHLTPSRTSGVALVDGRADQT